MKKIIKNIFLVFIVLFSTSCDSFFDTVPQDTTSLEKVFSSRMLALQWLSNVYSYLPDESQQNYTGGEDQTRGIWIPASIEGELPWEHCNSNLVNNGTLNPSTKYVQNMWKAYYRGIQKANVYLEKIDDCPDMDTGTKLRTKAEARALRSIYYFNLFKIYGPFVNIGDKVFDSEGDMNQMLLSRSTVDECVEYIVSEFDALLSENNLSSNYKEDGTFPSQFTGNISKQAVEAVRSQVLFYAASNLFNGDEFYKTLTDADGKQLFPQARNNEKWNKAKIAAKNLIDNNPQLQLVLRNIDGTKATTIESSCPYTSVSESFLGRETNEEIIFYYNKKGDWNIYYCMRPKHSGINSAQSGAGALAVPLQMMDLYFTKEGLRIEEDPDYHKYTNEEEDKFAALKMTSVTPYKDQYSGYTYFTPVPEHRIMKQFYNREPRFYVTFTFQNRRWDFDEARTYYTDFSLNGNSGQAKNGHDYPKSGVLVRKKLHKTGSVPYNIFIRLSEIYLNYAEACAELGEYKEAVDAINLIRSRAGVAEYGLDGDASMGARNEARIALNSGDVLNAVRRERLIELAYENHHYFDVRRWGVAGMAQGDGWVYPTWHQGGEGGNMMGFDVLVDMASGASGNTMHFYKRKTWETRVYTERMKLFPIPQSEINVNKKMVQNTGWGS